MEAELHGAEVWVTDTAELVVTVPYGEQNRQNETDLRGRLFRAVTHRFVNADEVTLDAYLQLTQNGELQTIRIKDRVLHSQHQYGVVLVPRKVHA